MTRAGAARYATTIRRSGDLWSRFMQKWIDHTAAIIEAERAQGAAPDHPARRDLATALNLMNERVMLASFADEQPACHRNGILDTLVHIWVTSIYGETR